MAFRLKAGGGAGFDSYAEKDLGADHDELYIQFALICPTAFLDIFGPLGSESTSGEFYGIYDNGASFVEGLLSHFDAGAGGSEVSWRTDNEFANFGGPVVADVVHCVQIHLKASTDTEVVRIDGVDHTATVSFSGNPLRMLRVGYLFGFATGADEFVYIGDVKVGTSGFGSSDVFADNFASGDLSNWDGSSGDVAVESGACSCGAGAAAKLGIASEPSVGCAGATLDPLIVLVQDADGSTVTGSTAAVTVALGANPGGGTLSGTLTVNAVAGVATFSDLSIDAAGVGYTLVASSSGLTSDTSDPFDIVSNDGDLCADPILISGTTGSYAGTNACAGHEAGDPLDAWYGITVAHTVFLRYVAPADGYLQLTISKPGGSAITKIVAGTAWGSCGSLAVLSDATVDVPAYKQTDDGDPPATFGTPVSAGDTVYVEVAVEGTGTPGTFTLAWDLRTITYRDCPAESGVQVGVAIPGEDPINNSNLVDSLDYLQDSDGNHWVAYWKNDTITPAQELHVAHAGPAAGSWTDEVVLSGPSADGVGFPVVQLAHDGTHVWVVALIRESGPDRISAVALEYGGGAWPQVAVLHGLSGNVGNSWVARINAHPADPGHAYVVFSDEDGSSAQTQIAKVDDTTTIWSATPLAVFGSLAVTNGSGSPVLFFAPQTSFAGLGSELRMYAVDPATGAVTLQQIVTYAERGQNTVGTLTLANFNLATEPIADAVDGASVYYLTALWSSPVSSFFNTYRIRADGSADFEWFDLDSTRSLSPYPVGFEFNGGIFPETDNVWVAETTHVAQFDRICSDGWLLWAIDDFTAGGSIDTAAVVKIGEAFWYAAEFLVGSGPDSALAVGRLDIDRLGCFCELGPTVGGEGPSLVLRFRLS